MKKILTLGATLVLALGLLAQPASAQGLIGKRYLALSFGNMLPGDDLLNEVDDTVMQLEARGNFPILKNLDVFAVLGYAKAEGNLGTDFLQSESKTKRAEVGAAYQFFPEQAFNPFLRATAGYQSVDSDNANESYGLPGFPPGGGTEEDFVYSLGGGIELPFGGQFAAAPSLTYRAVDDVDDFVGALEVNGWFNKIIFAGLTFAYGFDEGDLTYLGTLGFGF